MNENEDYHLVFYSMRHELKKSLYIFSVLSVTDILFIIGTVLTIGVIFFTFVANGTSIVNLLILVFILFLALITYILVGISLEIFHNGLGFFICLILYYFTKEEYVWGGVNCGFEYLQNEKETEKNRRKTNHHR